MNVRPIRFVVGLGNPGREYAGTRHNVGFMVLDRLASNLGVSFSRERKWRAEFARSGDVLLLKPQTFMNLSGESVAAVAAFHRIDPGECFVVFDDKDLPLGQLRLRERGSAGGHNGMRSIIAHLVTEAIPRLRFGIGPPEGHDDAVEHVLGKFGSGEREWIEKRLDRAVEAINYALRDGVARAMNVFNRNDDPPVSPAPPPANPEPPSP
jgi:PTH1 family peptidyl-tRNA hydrolase